MKSEDNLPIFALDPLEDKSVRSLEEDLVDEDEDEDEALASGGSTPDPPLSTAQGAFPAGQAGYCVSEVMVSSSSVILLPFSLKSRASFSNFSYNTILEF